MPSEPSGSDISGFVDLPTSPTQQHRHTEESSTFHLFFVDLHAYPVSNGLSNNIGSTQIGRLSRFLHELITQCGIRLSVMGVSRSEDPISLGM